MDSSHSYDCMSWEKYKNFGMLLFCLQLETTLFIATILFLDYLLKRHSHNNESAAFYIHRSQFRLSFHAMKMFFPRKLKLDWPQIGIRLLWNQKRLWSSMAYTLSFSVTNSSFLIVCIWFCKNHTTWHFITFFSAATL